MIDSPAPRRSSVALALFVPSALIVGMAISVAMAIALDAHRHDRFGRDMDQSPGVAVAPR